MSMAVWPCAASPPRRLPSERVCVAAANLCQATRFFLGSLLPLAPYRLARSFGSSPEPRPILVYARDPVYRAFPHPALQAVAPVCGNFAQNNSSETIRLGYTV